METEAMAYHTRGKFRTQRKAFQLVPAAWKMPSKELLPQKFNHGPKGKSSLRVKWALPSVVGTLPDMVKIKDS